jgi:hypothetical protein
MNPDELTKHLLSGGILTRLVHGEPQFIKVTVYGYGSANTPPAKALADVKAEPETWRCIDASTPGTGMVEVARELLEDK